MPRTLRRNWVIKRHVDIWASKIEFDRPNWFEILNRRNYQLITKIDRFTELKRIEQNTKCKRIKTRNPINAISIQTIKQKQWN